ncbi:hypothetical protein D3C85_1593970 [compost metagenome]
MKSKAAVPGDACTKPIPAASIGSLLKSFLQAVIVSVIAKREKIILVVIPKFFKLVFILMF